MGEDRVVVPPTSGLDATTGIVIALLVMTGTVAAMSLVAVVVLAALVLI